MLASAIVSVLLLWMTCCHSQLVPTSRKCTTGCNNSESPNDESSNEYSSADEDIRTELLNLERARILEKLRLDKPPDVRVSLHDLPAPVTKRLEENPLGEESGMTEVAEDAPGRLKSVYIVGERPRRGRGRNHLCTDSSGKLAVCIEFEVNGRPLVNQDILNAVLWVSLHFDHDPTKPDSNSISLNMSVSALSAHEGELMIGSAEVTSARSGHWVSINVTDHIRHQLIGRPRTHKMTILVACLGDDCWQRPPIAFSHTGRHRPFLELQTRRPEPDLDSRRKRSKLCGPGSTSETECCLETLFVNFTEIGWHTWILQPRGYETGYCKGRCQSTATRNFNAIMKAVLQKRRSDNSIGPTVDPEMAPCCSPAKMEPLEILYAKIENNHEQLSTAVLPAMIVSSCKC